MNSNEPNVEKKELTEEDLAGVTGGGFVQKAAGFVAGYVVAAVVDYTIEHPDPHGPKW